MSKEKYVEANIVEEGDRYYRVTFTCPYCGSDQIMTVAKTKSNTIPVACFDCFNRIMLKLVNRRGKKVKEEKEVEEKEVEVETMPKEEKKPKKKDILEEIREWVEEQDKIAESVRPHFAVKRLIGLERDERIYGLWIQYINGDKGRIIRIILGKRKGSYFGKTTIPLVDVEDLRNYYELLNAIFSNKKRVSKLEDIFEYVRAGTPRRRRVIEFGEEDLL